MTVYRSSGAGLLALALTVSAAWADLTPVSQDRTVRSTVSGSYVDAQGTNHPPPPDQMQQATGFSPFDASVSSSFAVPMGDIGSDVSSASQSSQIGPTVITASADATATDARLQSATTPLRYNYTSTGGSTFSYVFSVSQATRVLLSGTIHTDTTEDFAENAIANVSLNTSSGATLAYFASPSVVSAPVPPQYDAPVTFSGTLQPGTYSIFATVSASPYFVSGVDSERQHASFQIRLEQVPEPTCMPFAALALIGGALVRQARQGGTRGR